MSSNKEALEHSKLRKYTAAGMAFLGIAGISACGGGGEAEPTNSETSTSVVEETPNNSKFINLQLTGMSPESVKYITELREKNPQQQAEFFTIPKELAKNGVELAKKYENNNLAAINVYLVLNDDEERYTYGSSPEDIKQYYDESTLTFILMYADTDSANGLFRGTESARSGGREVNEQIEIYNDEINHNNSIEGHEKKEPLNPLVFESEIQPGATVQISPDGTTIYSRFRVNRTINLSDEEILHLKNNYNLDISIVTGTMDVIVSYTVNNNTLIVTGVEEKSVQQ